MLFLLCNRYTGHRGHSEASRENSQADSEHHKAARDCVPRVAVYNAADMDRLARILLMVGLASNGAIAASRVIGRVDQYDCKKTVTEGAPDRREKHVDRPAGDQQQSSKEDNSPRPLPLDDGLTLGVVTAGKSERFDRGSLGAAPERFFKRAVASLLAPAQSTERGADHMLVAGHCKVHARAVLATSIRAQGPPMRA